EDPRARAGPGGAALADTATRARASRAVPGKGSAAPHARQWRRPHRAYARAGGPRVDIVWVGAHPTVSSRAAAAPCPALDRGGGRGRLGPRVVRACLARPDDRNGNETGARRRR